MLGWGAFRGGGCQAWVVVVSGIACACCLLRLQLSPTPVCSLAAPLVPASLSRPISAISPLVLLVFARELASGFPAPKRDYVLAGIQHGFRVGFSPDRVRLRSRSTNMQSASEHPDIVDAYLAAELAAHRLAGPFVAPPLPGLHVSPFGVIPKNHQPGKWRLILDLSSPQGGSANDGIPKDPFSLHYVSVDDAIRALVALGPGALMAKFDVRAAYRNVPIHPEDRFLLGMKWCDRFYVDLVLPFGLRSAPFIFDSVASAVEWILVHNYAISPLFHYLDDFLTLGPACSPVCQAHVNTAFAVFDRLGLPLHLDKCEGPSTSLVFLGIQLDSVCQTARLPQEKVSRILQLLHRWARKSTCTRRELESLIGHLHHACRVVLPGRTFLRRMINLLCCFRNPSHPIRLNVEFRRDLHWWLSFFLEWNGVSFFLSPAVTPLPDLVVSSDASGTIGFGAVWRRQWFCQSWSFLPRPLSIAFMELVPIVVAAHVWGPAWSRLRVQFISDNMAVVAVLRSGTSRAPDIMHLLRSLTRIACLHHFTFSASHSPGRDNRAADALSRFHLQEFRRLVPAASPSPHPIPPALLASLVPPS